MPETIMKAEQLSPQQSEYMKLTAEIMEIRKRGERPLAARRVGL